MKILEPEKFVIARDDTIHEGWPDMIRTQTGKLICVYNECVSHGNRDHTHITLRESFDCGETWSEKRYIDIETFGGDQWNSIRLNQLRDGRLILVCDRIAGGELSPGTQMWMWESTDDGVTWTEGRPLGIYGFCSDKVRELRDGTLLMLVSAYDTGMERRVVYAHRSGDGGKTWSDRITAAKDIRYQFIEPAVLETSDGTLVAFLREESGKGYECMRVISHDGGLSWEGVYPIATYACNRPVIGYLDDGRIMLTYRLCTEGWRLCGAAVFDEQTAISPEYDPEKVKVFRVDRDTSESPDGGYTAWVQLEEGKIIMANYITDDAPRPYIRGYFFHSSDLH